jgi:hypothetical protein
MSGADHSRPILKAAVKAVQKTHDVLEAAKNRHTEEERRKAEEAQKTEADRVAAERHAKELEERRIREDERRKVENEHRAAEERKYKQHIENGNTLVSFKKWDAALVEFYTALGIAHGNKNAMENLISEFFNISFDFNNQKICEAYILIADCYQHKGEYLRAIQCYEKLQYTGINRVAAQNGIQLCVSKIKEQIDAKITAAQDARKNNDFAKAYQILDEALTLVDTVKKQDLLVDSKTKINQLNNRFKWEEASVAVIANYNKLMQIDLQDESLGDELIVKFENCLAVFKSYSDCLTASEKEMYSNLSRRAQSYKEILKDRKDLAAWNELKLDFNSKVDEIAKLEGAYSTEKLPDIVEQLTRIKCSYEKYSKFLSDADMRKFTQCKTMMADAQQKLEAYRARVLREEQRVRNRQREETIVIYKNNAYDLLLKGDLSAAKICLEKAAEIARVISYKEDLAQQNQNFTAPDYFASSLDILKNAIKESAELAEKLAKEIISSSVAKTTIGWNKELLERHDDRLMKGIYAALLANAYQFYKKQDVETREVEYAGFKAEIVEKIRACMTTTAWYERWSPTNWSNASLRLNDAMKKRVTAEVCAMIADYKAPTAPYYVQLPILPKPPMLAVAVEAYAANDGLTFASAATVA